MGNVVEKSERLQSRKRAVKQIGPVALHLLRLRATVAALMLMGVHSRRHLSARVTSRLESLRDAGDWSATVRTVWLQYIRSLDTEAISRKTSGRL